MDGTHPINSSLKMLFALYTQKESIVSLIPSLTVIEIYNFPDTPEQELTISGVDKNGTVDMVYNNKSVALLPGSTWTAPQVPEWNETNTVSYPPPYINGQINSNATNYTYTIQYNRTITIENKGVIDK